MKEELLFVNHTINYQDLLIEKQPKMPTNTKCKVTAQICDKKIRLHNPNKTNNELFV